MQSDGRLVTNVEDSHQPGAYLRGEPDALRLAAAESGGGARERQVVQTYVQQEIEPRLYLLEYLVRYGLFSLGEQIAWADAIGRRRFARDYLYPFERG